MGDLGKRAILISQHPAGWQRVLHGNETLLREEVTLAILKRFGEKSAFRYGACGLADVLVKDKNGVHVAPMGCGHRLCPRCGRTKGRPMIKRIFQWLAAEAHGDIFTMCLTQRVQPGEALPAARARMVRKEQAYLEELRGLGLLAAASCAHPIWSEMAGGWHYHVHLLLELPKGATSDRSLRARYLWQNRSERVQAGEKSASRVVEAGPADAALLDGSADPDMWTESKSGLAAAVQYPVRDIAQGISAKRMGGNRAQVAECVDVLLTQARGWKLRRTYGRWRKKAPKIVVPDVAKPEREIGEAEKKVSAACPGSGDKPVAFGTVHQLSRRAALGDTLSRLVFEALEGSCRNNTDFGQRFVVFCRAAARRASG